MKPVVLVVMDGVGLRDAREGNAFKQAETPELDSLMEDGYEQLEASGPAVGLPEGYTGNSEVGHLHMGAGRRVPQRLSRINEAIDTGELAENKALVDALERAEQRGVAFHLAGIVSDGGIHGHIDHLEALMEVCDSYELEQLWIHAFTDGRDVAPKSAARFLDRIEAKCGQLGVDAGIATVIGRYYAMDRDHNWDRTHRAYRAMAEAEGFEFEDSDEALTECYSSGDYDYFVQPSVASDYPGMTPDDELVFYNFRADRERQICDALLLEEFDQFENPVRPTLTSMFRYRREFDNPVMFEKKVVENTLGEKIAEAGLSQLRVAESQKRPHVTYFFNGQRELEFDGEERYFVESDKIKAYDQKPEMHADDTTDRVVEAIQEEEHGFIMINYANCDLVGHTGEMEAAVEAVETVDRNVGRLAEAVRGSDYGMLVTADHGNCEDMGSEESPNTSHTSNPVPAIGVDLDLEFEEGELWEVHTMLSTRLGLD
jgi:2,3-bisphosphoglycerate-independent phosphoglycerate mutase